MKVNVFQLGGAPFDIQGGFLESFEKKSPDVETYIKKTSLTWGVEKKNKK